ncbi:sterol desaturase family protein [Mucilaginibacter flavus]|uniref:sterol desaturase family protein n=1 Tax=Mucilaginibacter flavus TaxID=931504 RepID=UPI0025B54A62|nr:sterol desaturase family protein [Mucilaginibacter flavus]MDN3579713.1 sterol desaturase family protein [Mucilaginibacter flavus]
MLRFLSAQPTLNLWLIFLLENLAVTALALLFGWIILRLNHNAIKQPSRNEIGICLLTNVINTAITYAGFWLWQQGYIVMNFTINWFIVIDFVALFMLMDLAMFIFHYAIHHSVVYKAIHRFHHHYTDPTPIDLFVLHPIETVGFGSLWLITIASLSFNFYSVLIYLTVNVFFGIMGHLGIEPFPHSIRRVIPFRYLGTSTFHHNHHLNIHYNYGFYTTIWDKIFKTYKG